MKVYRFEHVDSGRGPYTHNQAYDVYCSCEWCQLDNDLTNILHDFKDYETTHPLVRIPGDSRLRFGCKSVEDLKTWFEPFVERLMAMGFNIYSYDVNPVYEDDYQVAWIEGE